MKNAKHYAATALIVVATTVPIATAFAAESGAQPVATLALFGSLPEARRHCPNDKVVKLLLPDGFFLHGDRGMGGASLAQVFVCAGEAQSVFAPPSTAKSTR